MVMALLAKRDREAYQALIEQGWAVAQPEQSDQPIIRLTADDSIG